MASWSVSQSLLSELFSVGLYRDCTTKILAHDQSDLSVDVRGIHVLGRRLCPQPAELHVCDVGHCACARLFVCVWVVLIILSDCCSFEKGVLQPRKNISSCSIHDNNKAHTSYYIFGESKF